MSDTTRCERQDIWSLSCRHTSNVCFLFVAYWLEDAATDWQNRMRCRPDWN